MIKNLDMVKFFWTVWVGPKCLTSTLKRDIRAGGHSETEEKGNVVTSADRDLKMLC